MSKQRPPQPPRPFLHMLGESLAGVEAAAVLIRTDNEADTLRENARMNDLVDLATARACGNRGPTVGVSWADLYYLLVARLRVIQDYLHENPVDAAGDAGV